MEEKQLLKGKNYYFKASDVPVHTLNEIVNECQLYQRISTEWFNKLQVKNQMSMVKSFSNIKK